MVTLSLVYAWLSIDEGALQIIDVNIMKNFTITSVCFLSFCKHISFASEIDQQC